MEVETKSVLLLPDTGEANVTKFILGATGSGKTTLAANLVKDETRFVIFDTRGEFDPTFFNCHICVCCDSTGFIRALNQGEQKIIFILATYDDDGQEQELDFALNTLQAFQMANKDTGLPPVTIVLDELNKFVSGQNTCHGLREVIQRGRGKNIQKIFGAQWFGTIPTWVRDSFSEIYAFRHNDKQGLARLEDYGFDSEQLKNLPQYNCLYCGKNGVKQMRLTPR